MLKPVNSSWIGIYFKIDLCLSQEVAELRNQIAQSGVQVDIDAPKGQDLAQVMEDMRANYEKLAVKNAEELKMWHENQVGYWLPSFLMNTELPVFFSHASV